MRLGSLALSLLIWAVACRQSTAPPVAVLVTLEPSATTVLRGDTLTVVVNATGNSLIGVMVEYGDSASDQYATGGAHTARVTFKHAFGTAGSFTIRAIVTDAIAGEKEATVDVVVN